MRISDWSSDVCSSDLFIPSITFAKGNYFAYAGKHPFRHLIYPTPEPGGLGTHLTLDLSGSARFGPDVEWISAIDYNVDEGRHSRFFKAEIGRASCRERVCQYV